MFRCMLIFAAQFIAEMYVIFCSQLLDVFGQKSNVSLVFDFMETDLEVRV